MIVQNSVHLSTADAADAVRVPAEIVHRIAQALRVEAVERGGEFVLKYRDSNRYLTASGYAFKSIEAAKIRHEARAERRSRREPGNLVDYSELG